MLLFKKKYFELIKAGQKVTTLRFWKSRRAKPGSIHKVPNLGKVFVEEVSIVRADSLSDDDAIADGFASAAELASELDKLYPPDKRDGRELYKIKFLYLAGSDSPGKIGEQPETTA